MSQLGCECRVCTGEAIVWVPHGNINNEACTRVMVLVAAAKGDVNSGTGSDHG